METEFVLDPYLHSILACPQDRGPLLLVKADNVFYNPRLRRAYPIDNGIPVLLIDDARDVTDDAEHERFVSTGIAAPEPEA